MDTPIVDMLQKTVQLSRARFHMPGHKGRRGFLPAEVLQYDITELPGTDNLYMPSGVILKSQRMNQEIFCARDCFYLVNGSSAGVVSSLLSVASPGDKVIFARDLHLSAINGIILAGIKPVFVYPSSKNTYLPSVVTVNDVKKVISENEDATAVYLTYPNYYGLCPDINEITALAHSVGMYVIADGAHAAAFAYSELLPVHPGEAACDIWTLSLHKTLGAPNQCAMLCLGTESGLMEDQVKKCVNMMQTTSPSYLLLASIDRVLSEMRENGEKQIADAVLLLEEYILRINKLGGYKCSTADIPAGTGAVDRDITRLVIDVTDRGMSGFMAEQKLCKRGIYLEGADHRNIILLCSIANTRKDFDLLLTELDEIKGTNYNIATECNTMHFNKHSQIQYSMRQIMLGSTVNMPFVRAVGKVAACTVGAYPPGVPFILPGQIIDVETLEHLVTLQNQGYTIFGTDGYTLNVADV